MINTLQNIEGNSQMSESGHINNPNVYESNSNSHVFSSMPQSTISEMISVFDNPGRLESIFVNYLL